MSAAADQDLATDARKDGAARRRRVQGRKTERLAERVARLDPGVAEWTDGFVFGQVWGRPGLAEQERILIAIAALAATGQPDELRAYLFGALERGVAPEKIRETLVMMTVCAGFPAALNALEVWQAVQESAQCRGFR